MSLIWLLEQRGVRASGDGGGDPIAPLVHRLGTDRAGRQQTADDTVILVDHHRDRMKRVGVAQVRTTARVDLLGDQYQAVVNTHHARSGRQRDQGPCACTQFA